MNSKLPAGSAASAIAMISAERMRVGLNGACDLLVLHRLRIQRDRAEQRFMLMCTMRHEGFEHFFHALEQR